MLINVIHIKIYVLKNNAHKYNSTQIKSSFSFFMLFGKV